ncbi:uncharacterized protein N7498_011016 [Penicillium cinerascens]|uniref:Uncharacterized protein n=1 Tax=Penicillium cinerascens TaxID=70096 RepID=A0A9W9JCW6_9EURO|nr:uncharacterized protein N7498_011016 [Penicillium cinerascens]KAJ5192031.1 hypothetical protein N7498_011016 [Penicillium cinerascens]
METRFSNSIQREERKRLKAEKEQNDRDKAQKDQDDIDDQILWEASSLGFIVEPPQVLSQADSIPVALLR